MVVQHILIILIVVDLVINVLSSFGKLFQISPPHAPVMRLKILLLKCKIPI